MDLSNMNLIAHINGSGAALGLLVFALVATCLVVVITEK